MMNSAIPWMGGKRLLRKQIIDKFPKHDLYCEVFGGAGWVLFGKSAQKADWTNSRSRGYSEVYNDINGDLINFWRHMQHHAEALVIELQKLPISREWFTSTLAQSPRTDLERAARFCYLLCCSYSGLSKTFTAKTGQKMLPLRNLEKAQEVTERLKHVIIEHMDFARLIERYDRPTALFYLDPPYYQHEELYQREDAPVFARHEELAQILGNIKGKFVLSYNDDPYIRELYKGCKIQEVLAPYTACQQVVTKIELLISNY